MTTIETLAEAIILQSLEDLWDPRHRAESIAFLAGPDFGDCVRLAGMTEEQQRKLMNIVAAAFPPPPRMQKQRLAGRVFPSPRTLPVPPQPTAV